jgi:hypothetical protein
MELIYPYTDEVPIVETKEQDSNLQLGFAKYCDIYAAA